MTPGQAIKVLVVEDSIVVQRLLEETINADPRLRVVGKAADADEAMRLIDHLDPDVVTMDIRLPRTNGFEATRRIMRDHPLPIVVVAANVDDAALDISMNALRAGALTVVEKPSGLSRADYDRVAGHLCTQLAIMSQVKVVRQRGRAPRGPAPVPPAPSLPRDARMVGMVASTGGPGALSRILGGLRSDFPLPIAVVQHMGAPFTAGFAHWLDSVSNLPVALAEDGLLPLPSHVYVAPGDTHLVVAAGVFRLDRGPLVCGQRPSGDRLFHSMAGEQAGRAVGILLTGMGEDGARGLLDLRRSGGYTVAESAATAVIWGMPGTAVALGAACEQLPLDAIAGRLGDLAAASREAPS